MSVQLSFPIALSEQLLSGTMHRRTLLSWAVIWI